MRRILLVLLFIPLLVDAQGTYENEFQAADLSFWSQLNFKSDSILEKMYPSKKFDPTEYKEAFFTPTWKEIEYRPFATITPTHTISIMGNNKETLSIDLRGDSVIVSGDLKMNEAAKRFIDFLRIYVHTKIDSLENELYATNTVKQENRKKWKH